MMARTFCVARRRRPPPVRQRRILVASLLVQDPTTAEQGGATDDNFAVEREATASLPGRRRTRSRRVAVAPLDLPEEIVVWEIVVRLPAKDILRCRAPLSCLSLAGRIQIVAFYLHRPSGEYCLLYWKERDRLEAAYYILMVLRGRSPRCIGIPSDTPGIGKAIYAWDGMTPSNYAPPIVFRNCLHWDSGLRDDARIVVFDTVVELFRFMRRPDGATNFCTRLCDMEGSIGLSCFDDEWTTVKIWVLEDYEREAWSIKYHVTLPEKNLFHLFEDKRYLVLSQKGDVLVYSCSTGYMFHCDNTGKLLEEFRCSPWSLSIIGHCFKESLIKQDISLRRCGCVRQLRFFQKL